MVLSTRLASNLEGVGRRHPEGLFTSVFCYWDAACNVIVTIPVFNAVCGESEGIGLYGFTESANSGR